MDTLIPYDSLAPATLANILEDIVTRDGTDYGNYDLSLEQKCQQAMTMLQQGNAFLVFDTESETIKLLNKEQLNQYQ
ncbi:YheU family protein [Marinomonas agarivorans]|nr:YheU family protein [Marinomonas agarivorans]